MTRHQPHAQFAAARLLAAPPVAAVPVRAQRTFGFHPVLHMMVFGAFASFLAILGATFMTAQLILPFAIFAIFLVMAFVVPALWARIADPQEAVFQSWSEFLEQGIQTGSGHLTGREAIAQVMTLLVLMNGWAVAVAVIKASL